MTATPFMQLYIADYLGDTLHLTTEQHGAYLLILMAMWRADGRLPNDPTKLARIARVSPRRWHLLADDVMAFFDIEGGEITQKRLVEERQKAVSISEKRSASGKLGGTAKSLKSKNTTLANAKQMPQHSQKPDTRDNYTAGAGARSIDHRMGELYAALGVTDETKLPSLLTFSEPIQWVSAGCDIDADILPALRTIAARGKAVKSWSYCTAAVFEARDRRLAPAPAIQPQATAPPRKPRTVAELAIHRLETGQTTHEPPDEPDRRVGQSLGSGQAQGPGVLELVAIAANGHR